MWFWRSLLLLPFASGCATCLGVVGLGARPVPAQVVRDQVTVRLRTADALVRILCGKSAAVAQVQFDLPNDVVSIGNIHVRLTATAGMACEGDIHYVMREKRKSLPDGAAEVVWALASLEVIEVQAPREAAEEFDRRRKSGGSHHHRHHFGD